MNRALAIALLTLGTALVLFAAFASHAHAAGFAVAEQSATAGGTAGAGTARADDPGAAWYDPAALADDGGWRIGIGLLAARPSLSAQAQDGSWQTDSESAWATPPNVSLSRAAGGLVFGVWLGVPFGSGVTWPADWPGRHEITRSELTVFRAAPFAAWRSGGLRIGGGLHLDAGRLQVARKLDFIDTDGDVAIDMDGTGIGVDLSLFYEASPAWSLGLSYKSRTTLSLSGGANFTTPDAFSEKTADQQASSSVTLPDRLVAGARWSRGRFAALADVELTLWGVNDTLTIDFVNDQTPDAVQVNDWSATVAVRGGGEYTRGKLTLRGGAYYDPSPAPDDKLAPSSPDSSRIGLTTGASWALSSTLSVDAFYEYMALLGRDSSSTEALPASYGGHAQLLGLGVRWIPGADDDLSE